MFLIHCLSPPIQMQAPQGHRSLSIYSLVYIYLLEQQLAHNMDWINISWMNEWKNYVLMSTLMCQRYLKCHMPQNEFLTYPLHLHSKCTENFSILANMLINHTGVRVRNWMKFFSISLPFQINQLLIYYVFLFISQIWLLFLYSQITTLIQFSSSSSPGPWFNLLTGFLSSALLHFYSCLQHSQGKVSRTSDQSLPIVTIQWLGLREDFKLLPMIHRPCLPSPNYSQALLTSSLSYFSLLLLPSLKKFSLISQTAKAFLFCLELSFYLFFIQLFSQIMQIAN